MATVDQLYQLVLSLKAELEARAASARINPKQVAAINGLSDISKSLGVVSAGEFLALSKGEDPIHSDAVGTFISALGRVFGDKTYHIGGVNLGDLKWGVNSETGELEAGDGTVVLTDNGLSIYLNEGADEVARLGNLNGFLDFVTDTYGFAVGDDTQYLKYDPDNGLEIYGALTTDREILAANRTYYVNSGITGSDSNNGESAAAPFLTIQKAVDTVASLDARDFDITIQLTGSFIGIAPITLKSILGSGTVTITGDTDTPTNVVLNGTGDVFQAEHLTTIYKLEGMNLISAGYGVNASHNSHIQIGVMDFGACTFGHLFAHKRATIEILTGYTISGDSAYHYKTAEFGYVTYDGDGITVTLSDTPTFTTFADAEYLASIYAPAITWTGAGAGQKFYVDMNSIIYVNDTTVGGVDYFPGDAAGATATGGQYA